MRPRALLTAAGDDDAELAAGAPALAAAAPELARALAGGDAAFGEGLERLLDGLRA